ncbi:hypothetical protein [Candidatus Nanohalobium constans]|uniref:Uncharacterized protein n=1 Tax=Candidatus Nanohalobium constans TaxID=2565781 RepID=A0A5Q0UH20_9ARCH|nr:hypothetical protein [Candidatus Nanohalobium constans]QGA80884.1 hypothetical protein LC1Nh_1008 [Candidatus Nanohalobium constans]
MKMEEVDYEDKLSEIPNPSIEKVREKYEEKKSEIDEEAKRKELKNSLKTRKNHDDIVGKISSAFHQAEEAEGSETGYEFAFTEPLEEKGLSNADVLLVKDEGDAVKLCIVECKSGSNYSSWMEQISSIEDVLNEEENKRELKAQIGCRKKDISFIQYVVATNARNLAEVKPDRYDYDYPSNLAVWGLDEWEQSLYAKEDYNCNDSDLSSKVGDGIDYGKIENPIMYTVSSHPVIILKNVLFELLKSNQSRSYPKEFNEEEFYDEFNQNLQMGVQGPKRDQLVEEKLDNILYFAEDIEILSDEDVRSTKDYRMKFRGKKPPMVEEAVESKFLKNRPVRIVSEEAFKEALDEYESEGKQGNLGNFTD